MSLFLSGVNTSRYLTRSKQQLLTSADSRRARKVHAIEVHEQEARQGIKGSAIATMGPSHCENSATLPLMNRNADATSRTNQHTGAADAQTSLDDAR